MSLDLERAIIGAALDPELSDDILAAVTERYFSTEMHRTIFRCIVEVSESTTPDVLIVAQNLERHGIKSGTSYLAECWDMGCRSWQLKKYLADFEDQWRHRECLELARTIYDHQGTGREIDAVIAAHTDDAGGGKDSEMGGEILKRVIKDMERRSARRGEIQGIPTGWSRYDRNTGGLIDGNLIILAARPSIGKTAAAMNIVEHVAVNMKIPVIMFTLEMSGDELMQRTVLSMAGVDSNVAKTAEFTDADYGRMLKSMGDLNNAPLHIVDSSSLTMAQIRAKARAAQRRHGIKLVVIDYLGLVDGPGTEYERVTAASRAAKKMAKDMKIPVLALHQLNRGNEQRTDKRPTMSDLRSSGQLEQDADIITLLHRKKEAPEEEAEIIVDKNRNGPTGIISAGWNGPLCRYFEATKTYGG